MLSHCYSRSRTFPLPIRSASRPDRPNSTRYMTDQLRSSLYTRVLPDRYSTRKDTHTTTFDTHSDLYSIIPISTRSLTLSLLEQLDLYSISTRPARPGRTRIVNWSCMDIFVFKLQIFLVSIQLIPEVLGDRCQHHILRRQSSYSCGADG